MSLSSQARPFAPSTFAAGFPDILRIAFIAFCFAATCVGVSFFADLTDVAVISTSEAGNSSNQLLYSFMGAISLLVLLNANLRCLSPLAVAPLLSIVAWFTVTTLLSVDVSLSLRRSIALYFTVAAAIAVFMIARDKRQLAYAMAGSACAILVVCYISLIVVPDLAMHTGLEIREPEHAGSWRGLFSHKNGAGAVMVEFIFFGIFAAKAANKNFGWIVTILASVFLLFTRAKTSIALLPLILLQVHLCRRVQTARLRAAILLTPLILLLLVSVGPLFIGPLKSLVTTLFPGLTFTGRTEIWDFAVENIYKRPWTGFGFGAFWQTEAVFYGSSEKITWVNAAGHAHNAYLDTLIFTGVPGLALTIWWLIVMPLRDLQRQVDGPAIKEEQALFVSIWLFALMSAVFEGRFYIMGNGFFTLLIAVFGLRFGTRARFV